MPSFGCDREQVDYIVKQLNERMRARGEAAQTAIQERVVEKALSVHEKTELINQHFENLKKAPPVNLSIGDR